MKLLNKFGHVIAMLIIPVFCVLLILFGVFVIFFSPDIALIYELDEMVFHMVGFIAVNVGGFLLYRWFYSRYDAELNPAIPHSWDDDESSDTAPETLPRHVSEAIRRALSDSDYHATKVRPAAGSTRPAALHNGSSSTEVYFIPVPGFGTSHLYGGSKSSHSVDRCDSDSGGFSGDSSGSSCD